MKEGFKSSVTSQDFTGGVACSKNKESGSLNLRNQRDGNRGKTGNLFRPDLLLNKRAGKYTPCSLGWRE
jgi:hypothetical protein